MAQTPKPVAIDTATLAKPIGATVAVRIGGTVYEAHCPKDAVLARIQRDGTDTIDTVTSVIAAMIGRDAGEQVAEMLADEDNDEVSIGTLSQMIQYLMEHPDGPKWAEALTENLKALGSGETPRTIPVRRSAPARAPRAAKRR